MDIPHFIQDPPTETEIKTFLEMIKGKTAKEAAAALFIADDTAIGHAKNLRFKYHSTKLILVLVYMVGLGHITREQLMALLPPEWHKHIEP